MGVWQREGFPSVWERGADSGDRRAGRIKVPAALWHLDPGWLSLCLTNLWGLLLAPSCAAVSATPFGA